MMKKFSFIKAMQTAAIMGMGYTTILNAGNPVSPWDKGQQELQGSAACPIKYPKTFMRERDILNYNPRFLPGQLSFTPDNRPVIRVGLMKPDDIGKNGQTAPSRAMGEINLIQYLGKDGRWYTTDGHVKAVREALHLKKEELLTVQFGERTNDTVEFDGKGGAYTIVNTNRGCFLVWSPDEFNTFWATVFKGGSNVRLEPFRYHIGANRAIRLLCIESGNVMMRQVEIKNNRPLVSGPILLVSKAKKPAVQISSAGGAAPAMLTACGKTFIVYMGQIPIEGESGSPHYIIEYDHATGKVSKPVFLGTTGDKIDNHNLPVLDIDSKGYLHVIGGAHWHPFKHWTSKKPYSIQDGWSEPEGIGSALGNRWTRNGLSYPGFVIDRNDTLHIIARGRNAVLMDADTESEYQGQYEKHLNYALLYLRRKKDGQWEKRKDLVIPEWKPYSNWYQKVTMDRKGIPYCTYFYFTTQLYPVPAAYEDYCRRWPEEKLRPGRQYMWDVKAHDPVIIGSFNQGDTWQIITTADFIANSQQGK